MAFLEFDSRKSSNINTYSLILFAGCVAYLMSQDQVKVRIMEFE